MKLMNNILITGGAGFIRIHLTHRLISQGHKVTILDNLSVGKIENIKQWSNNPNFTLIKGDLKNPKDIAKAVQLSQTGWKPKYTSEQAIRQSTQSLIRKYRP